jgi:hypothetical protein
LGAQDVRPRFLSAANKEVAVARLSWLKYTQLAHLSKPRSVRQLYRLVKRHKICRIVEVGVSDLERSLSLIRVAERYAVDGRVAYTGIDWFDARSADQTPLTLKQAHSRLQTTSGQVRLVPGEPGRSLRAIANAHQHTGLLLISAAVADSELAAAWYFVPRMLDAASIVLRERLDAAGEPEFERFSTTEIGKLAHQATARRAA